MYSEVKIDSKLTKATFGYDIKDLSNKSKKKIIVICKNCQRVIHREYRNRNARHQCPSVEGNNKRCYKCREWKDLSLFNKSPKLSGGVAKLCRNCYNNHAAVIKAERSRKRRLKNSFSKDIEYYIRSRFYAITSRCKRKNIDYNITADFLLKLWKKQNGVCYYTNLEMNNSMKQDGFQCWNSPSLDRVDPSKGYTTDNVVWCIFSVNSFKQSLDLEQFKDQISNIKWWFNN